MQTREHKFAVLSELVKHGRLRGGVLLFVSGASKLAWYSQQLTAAGLSHLPLYQALLHAGGAAGAGTVSAREQTFARFYRGELQVMLATMDEVRTHTNTHHHPSTFI